jgi:hypothetical protein
VYFKYGSRGFSILSMVVSFVLLGSYKKSTYKMGYSEFDHLWFIGIFAAYVFVIVGGYSQLKKLDEIDSIDE